MKSLVTGCAGFIGSHLTERLLDEGFEVIGVDCFTDYYPRNIKEDNLEKALKSNNFTFIEKDITAFNQFPDVDYIFHQAAQAGVRKSWGKEFEIYLQNNILATQKLLEFYKDKPVEILAEDEQYMQWLLIQDWFKNRYKNIYNVVINNFSKEEYLNKFNSIFSNVKTLLKGNILIANK